jgi:hypothetical protein
MDLLTLHAAAERDARVDEAAATCASDNDAVTVSSLCRSSN